MIAAVYARKSTDQSVNDEVKSVTRQIAHAREYASRMGWTVADEHVFVDDGISGAEFSARPGYMRLLNALKPRAPFAVLLVSELSRLGREQLETGYAVKQLAQAGVRIFSYLDAREVLLDTPTDKFLMSAVNFAAEIEREKGRQRVTDTMTRKARAGHVCGGAVFGYDNVAATSADGARAHVVLRINEAHAAVVRRIFELSGDGNGFRAIAKRLNAEGAVSPRAQRGRLQGWAPSSVREVLLRDLYHGQRVWNKTKKRDAWGQKRQQPRPEAEWIRVEVPALRIVSEALWQATRRRLSPATKPTHPIQRAGRPRVLLPDRLWTVRGLRWLNAGRVPRLWARAPIPVRLLDVLEQRQVGVREPSSGRHGHSGHGRPDPPPARGAHAGPD